MNYKLEWLKCAQSPEYFVTHFVHIYNATLRAWIPFDLWPTQISTLTSIHNQRLLVILKARQLGLSWLSLAYALWMITFQAPATILLFSLKEAESIELLVRLHAMYNRLPSAFRSKTVVRSASKHLELSNGSRALAFSTRGGRSYTGSLAIVDEADFVPDLALFLNAVKPTIDAGGRLLLISTSDKRRPVSTFKNLFRAAVKNIGDYSSIFLPWRAHPERDDAWHKRTRAEMHAQRGTDDDFFAEYPATPEEALAPEQLDRRIPLEWITPCIVEAEPLLASGEPGTGPASQLPPALPPLAAYVAPAPDHHYVIGADPAEGNPNSDDSSATVMDAASWEEVASFAGKIEPTVFAHYLDTIAAWYNHASIMPERNNHGHSLIAALHNSGQHRVLTGFDGKPGWLSNVKGKILLYDHCADAFRDQSVTVTHPETISQLSSIEASTLRAPQGLHDDRADSFALAVAALATSNLHAQPSTAVKPHDPLTGVDDDQW
ncbi:hypothetical protein LCGC14_0759820 [marine sediment metagenome]|uniref:Uncharacterized protein n=1 Tax=marine sediment metagenome TaxID=412755 RepID=A0A0F9QLG5_9ZZZZ